jgi:endonuclease YncB( thermonuclease family)
MFQYIKSGAVVGMLFFAFVSFWPALDDDHTGPATVISAGEIEVGGVRHTFYGVRAVAPDHRCRRRNGEEWTCGHLAAPALAKFLEGRMVNCDVWGKGTRDDQGRFISNCYTDGDDIAAWLAQNGWAIADPDANRLYNYTSKESMGRFLYKGVWSDR